MGCGSTANLLLGVGGMGERVEDGAEGGRAAEHAHWGHGGGGRVLGCHHLRAGSIELPPLVVKNRGLALPLNPSPGHWAQSIDALPQVGVEHLLKVVDQPDVGPWTSNCWMSLSMELAGCHRVESFCCAVASQFRSVNTRSTSALNLSIIIGIPEGLRTCWILCIAHVPAAPPFMYDRMNSIWLISSGNSDPHRCMYRLHSALKQSRSSCRPVNTE